MEIIFSKDIFNNTSFFPKHFVAVCDENVAALYGHHFENKIVFPPGEVNKSRETKAWIEDQLEPGAPLLALGGGVTTDLVGFIAATFNRGIPYFSIPTSLLAMVDASIGGKTGINTPRGKNMIGAYYPPERIGIDTSLLTTLPKEELSNGWAEIIKYAFIHSPNILNLDFESIVRKCIEIKLEITKEDPRCTGRRNTLNFGHTVGHAIESASHFKISHGNAISIGMIAEAKMLGNMDMADKLYKVLSSYGLQTDTDLPSATLIDYMKRDKKGSLAFSILDEPFITQHSISTIESAL